MHPDEKDRIRQRHQRFAGKIARNQQNRRDAKARRKARRDDDRTSTRAPRRRDWSQLVDDEDALDDALDEQDDVEARARAQASRDTAPAARAPAARGDPGGRDERAAPPDADAADAGRPSVGSRDDDEPTGKDHAAGTAAGRPPSARDEPDARDAPDGPTALVVAVDRGRVHVRTVGAGGALGDERALAAPRGEPLAVGDAVLLEATGARVVERLPRRSVLARPDPAHRHRQLVLAANVDLAAVVVNAAAPKPGLVERVLAACSAGGIEPLVCANKIDLLADDAARQRFDAALSPWSRGGVRVVPTSARTGEGLGALRAALAGASCVLLGHSGVGKSSLLNALDPDGARAVGDVRAADGKGRHTTTRSGLRELADGTRVIDTPGVRAFGLAALDAAGLAAAFPDVVALAPGCRFADCTHRAEPDCAVRAAAASGALDPSRLVRWQRLVGPEDDG